VCYSSAESIWKASIDCPLHETPPGVRKYLEVVVAAARASPCQLHSQAIESYQPRNMISAHIGVESCTQQTFQIRGEEGLFLFFLQKVHLLSDREMLYFKKLDLTICRTLLVNKAGLEHAKSLISAYKQGKIGEMNDELWKAKKIVDSTLHPGTYSKVQRPMEFLTSARYW
jgi:hypothetical protein